MMVTGPEGERRRINPDNYFRVTGSQERDVVFGHMSRGHRNFRSGEAIEVTRFFADVSAGTDIFHSTYYPVNSSVENVFVRHDVPSGVTGQGEVVVTTIEFATRTSMRSLRKEKRDAKAGLIPATPPKIVDPYTRFS